jgi:hypothetical protein
MTDAHWNVVEPAFGYGLAGLRFSKFPSHSTKDSLTITQIGSDLKPLNPLIVNFPNPFSRTMTLGFTQPLTEMRIGR